MEKSVVSQSVRRNRAPSPLRSLARRVACQCVQFIRYLGWLRGWSRLHGAREISCADPQETECQKPCKQSDVRHGSRPSCGIKHLNPCRAGRSRLLNRRVRSNDGRTKWADCDNLLLLQGVVDEQYEPVEDPASLLTTASISSGSRPQARMAWQTASAHEAS